MEFLLNRFRNLTVLLVVVMAQLLLLAYQVKGNQDVRLIRMWSVTAVTPLAKVLEVVRRNTIGIVEDYFVLINVREENRRLADELGKMKMENHFLKSELQTADRAQALRAFQARTPSSTIPARIIGTGTGANSKVVYVDRGSGAGVLRGMAVVTPEGIVGKVLDSYPTASQVLLITDPSFAAGVISQKNRVHGTIKGLGQSKCLVDYVQNEEKVEPGEMFYTSGDDRIFPKGMPVGRVTVVRQGRTFKEIFVVPNGIQNGLEEVLIVVQGEHQAIPNEVETAATPGMYLMDPPKADTATGPAPSVLATEADRLRAQYKEVGEAQGHQFGEGGPGARPPNFNLRVEQPKPAAPAAAAPTGGPSAAPVATNTPQPVTSGPTGTGQAPVTAGAAGQPAVARPKPSAGTGAAGQPTSIGTAAPQQGVGTDGQPPAPRPRPAAATGAVGQSPVSGAPANQQPTTARPKPPAATGVVGQPTSTGTGAPQQRVGADGQPVAPRPRPAATTGAAGQSTVSGAPTSQQPTTARPKPPIATGVVGQPTSTGTAAPQQRVGADGEPAAPRPRPAATNGAVGQSPLSGAPTNQQPTTARPKPAAATGAAGQPTSSGTAAPQQRVGADGQPVAPRPRPSATTGAVGQSPLSAAPTNQQPTTARPKAPATTSPAGQAGSAGLPASRPQASDTRPAVSRTKPPITVEREPEREQPNRRVVTNESTINVITPAPKPQNEPNGAAAGPRSQTPAAAKPKPDRSAPPATP